MTLRVLALGLAVLASPLAAEECPSDVKPVVSLGFGSRYTDDSKTRSDFDEEGDKAVTAALKPIDDFIADLARQTDILHDPESAPEAVEKASACVLESIRTWAKAGALSKLTTQGANLSAPSRVGGIAFAYAAVLDKAPDTAPDTDTDTARDRVIEDWLRARARQTMDWFDAEAPPRASQNNLRAWAGLAVTRVGLTLDDPALIDWGADSAELVACTADADGSLPNEMWRGKLALHYQLHAVAPLVVTAALLQDRRPGLVTACNRAIPRVVDFTLAALADPAPVEAITGKPQSVGGPDKPPRDHELAWIPAWLQLEPDADLAARSKRIKKLGNSKLGGDQRLLWPSRRSPAPSDG